MQLMSLLNKRIFFFPVYVQTSVCVRFLSSERCSPVTQRWLTSFTGELKIIMMKLTVVGFGKEIQCEHFQSLIGKSIGV